MTKEVLEAFKESIEQSLRCNLHLFKGDKGMVACVRQDAKDLKKVLRLCKAGKLEEAARLTSNLDTIVRDAIPNSVWLRLMRANGD